MLDIDLGPALRSFLLLFVVLPLAVAIAATIAIERLVRDATRRLSIAMYVMLVCALVAPAPVLWRDDHLGLMSSQALTGYGALFWTVGALVAVDSLTGVVKRRQVLVLTLAAPLVLGAWVLGGTGAGLGLALIPTVGTLTVVLVLGWLDQRSARSSSAMNWPWAAGVGAICACVIAGYVYLRGPQVFGAQASATDLALLGVLACLPIVVLARFAHPPRRSAPLVKSE
ncbi:MAG TPA: hypothetical protein VGL99_04030 [Chloroflexota bacterium]